jgi:hypothetical protein
MVGWHGDKHNRSSKNQAIVARRLMGGLLALLLALLVVRPAAAHAGDAYLRVAPATVGPYQVTVWTAPSFLRAGEIHVLTLVTVADAAGATHASEVLVQVQATPLDDATGAVQTALAGPADPTNGHRCEAALRLDKPGRYRFTVSTTNPNRAGGTVSFEAEVIRAPAWLVGLLYAQLAATGLACLWLARAGYRVWFQK